MTGMVDNHTLWQASRRRVRPRKEAERGPVVRQFGRTRLTCGLGPCPALAGAVEGMSWEEEEENS